MKPAAWGPVKPWHLVVLAVAVPVMIWGSFRSPAEPAAKPPAVLPSVEAEQPKALSADAADIRDYLAVKQSIEFMENEFTARMDEMRSTYAEAKDAPSPEAQSLAVAKIKDILQDADELLNGAADLTSAPLHNAEAKQHLDAAVIAHKGWALAQRQRVAAIQKLDHPAVRKSGAAADELAMKEGSELIQVERALGIGK